MQAMIRLREIRDPELRERVRLAIGEWRGMSAGAVPDWFEMDDADYVDLLNALRDGGNAADDDAYDGRM